VERKRAARSSSNRQAGTWETKSIKCTKETYMRMIINDVIPAIRERWPHSRSANPIDIRIQHDNARPHNIGNEPAFIAACTSHPRFVISLQEQPSNSPDLNVLDLGLFRSLQSLQWRQSPPPSTIDDLLRNVRAAYSQYEPWKLYKVFITHQACMDLILILHGDNHYQIPHHGKDRLAQHFIVNPNLPLSEKAKEVWRDLVSNVQSI
jgi:hypothetical protein